MRSNWKKFGVAIDIIALGAVAPSNVVTARAGRLAAISDRFPVMTADYFHVLGVNQSNAITITKIAK